MTDKTFNESLQELGEAVNVAMGQLSSSLGQAAEQIGLAMSCKMRRFYLRCHVDDILGDVAVAEGVVFEDQSVALRWRTSCFLSAVSFASIGDLQADLRARGCNTVTMKYIDPEPAQ